MITYYALEDNKITMATTDERVAKNLNLTLTTTKTIKHNRDGVLDFEDNIPEPTIEEQNEAIKHTRASLYASLIDPLHAEKFRKTILNEWTPELEAEYVQKVISLTEEIKTDYPYVNN